MDLMFWRHAEAEDEREGLPDLERALTARGEKQAARVGAWLDRHLPDKTRILCSPALRCEQTALALGRRYKLRDALQPGALAGDLLQAAQWPDAKQPVLIVGHQPVIGQAVAQLLRIEGGNCAVRKGGVWWLRGRGQGEEGEVVVWAVLTPDVA